MQYRNGLAMIKDLPLATAMWALESTPKYLPQYIGFSHGLNVYYEPVTDRLFGKTKDGIFVDIEKSQKQNHA